MARERSLDDAPNTTFGREARRKPSDMVELFQPVEDKYVRLRPFGPVVIYAGHWVKTRDKDTGKWRAKGGSFYIPCSAWDMDSAVRKGGDGAKHCAFCAMEAEARQRGLKGDAAPSRFSTDTYINVIVRSRQAKPPADIPTPTRAEQKTGFKDINSESWTPVSVLRMTAALVSKVQEQKQLNVHEDESGNSVAYAPSHPKYGCDILVMKRKNPSTPADTYAVNKGDPKPLSREERAYLRYDLTDLSDLMDEDQVRSEFESWARRNRPFGDSDDAPDGADRTQRKRRSRDDDAYDDAPTPRKRPAADDGFDDAPPPRAARKKTRDLPLDDDYADDKDDKDDFDDEPPPRAAGKKRPPADDFDDEPPPRATGKKRPPADNFDDEPPPRAAGKKRPPADDFDDDKDDKDNFDDEPPPRAAGKKRPPADNFDDEPPPRATGKKRPPADDGFDDEPPPRRR